MKPRIAPLAAAGLLALASLNGWIAMSALRTLHDDPAVDRAVEWHAQLSTSGELSVVQKPIGDYPMTVAHPVFYKTREPFVPPPPPPPPAPPKVVQSAPPAPVDPGLILGGVMASGQLRKAYLLTKANAAGSWVAEGDDFMGWIIKSVDNSSATVQQQDRTIELQLYPQDQVSSSPTVEGARGVIPRVSPPPINPGPLIRPPLMTTPH
jgi:hypothetical protein